MHKNLQKTKIRKSSNTTENTRQNQSQLPKPWDDKKISIFKRQSDQQNVFSNGFFAQNALNDSCLWMNCLFLATFGYGYVYNLISKTLSSYNDKKKKEKNHKTRTQTLSYKEERLACSLERRDLPEFIYCLIT